MEHSFDVEEARILGIEEATILKHFRFWIIKNEKNKRHYLPVPAHYNMRGETHRYWTYSSANALAEIFCYMTPKKVYNVCTSLEKAGILVKGNFNEKAYDRTTWYAFAHPEGHIKTVPELQTILPKGKMEKTKRENASAEKGTPIPDSLTDDSFFNKKEDISWKQKFSAKEVATEWDRLTGEIFAAHGIAHIPMNWSGHGATMKALKEVDRQVKGLASRKYGEGYTEENYRSAFEFVMISAFSYYNEIAKGTKGTVILTPDRINRSFNQITNHGIQRAKPIAQSNRQTVADNDGW